MATKTTKCDAPRCESSYQDEKYGQGIRIFNTTTKDNGKLLRCTVCGSSKTPREESPAKSEAVAKKK